MPRPGSERFAQRPTSSNPYAPTNSGTRSCSTIGHAGGERRLGAEPDDDRQEQQGEKAQPNVGEVAEPASEDEAKDEAERDADDQHRVARLVVALRSCTGGITR